MSTLEIATHEGAGGARVALRGVIDANLSQVLRVDRYTEGLLLDLEGVTRITSFGVREWVALLRRARASYLGFLNVRPTMVAQFNMVSGFDGGGQLISLFLPYLCEGCGHEEERLMDLRHEYNVVSADAPPSARCPACGDAMELDEMPSTYFDFARSHPRPSPPPSLLELIDGEDAARGARPFRARKEIDGELTALWLSGELSARVRIDRLLDGVEGRVVVLCQKLTGFTEAQCEALAPLSRRGLNLSLARAPIALLDALPAGMKARFEERVVSLVVPLPCERCARSVDVELERADAHAALVAGQVSCPICGSEVDLSGAGASLAAAFPMLQTEVSAQLRAYLDARPGAHLTDTSRDAAPAYRILGELGRGGMAEVFVAERQGPGGFAKRVALKRILPKFGQQPGFVELFLHEARTAARIDHPNVARIFDLGKDADRFYIVMELVRGWDLSTVLSNCRRHDIRMPVELACRVAADVCAGLHAAHTLPRGGIVHRDVSPHNVLVSDEGIVKLTDFGIAQAIGDDGGDGKIRGKIVYMAPEQVDTSLGSIDPRTDVYAVGLLLYECLTNVAPLYRNTRLEVLQAAIVARVPDVREARDEVPSEVAAILSRALSRAASDRYDSALKMQLALDAALARLEAPSTTAHLAQWLETVRARAAGQEDASRPMRQLTPPGFTDTVIDDVSSATAAVTFVASLIDEE